VKQKDDGIFISQDKSMIRSLMYLTASRPNIMFVVCACARDSPFDLEAFSDSDYAGSILDKKTTTGGCQFLGKRLISWKCKKQTIVSNSTTKAEYVAVANCYGQIALAEPFNDVYVTPVHTKKVFTNMKRQNKDFSGTVTPLFASMLVPQVVEGEGSRQPSEPQPSSSTTPPSHEEQSSGPPKKVGDEAIYTREDDRVVRVATSATSLEAEQESGSRPKFQDTTLGDADAQTRFKTASKQSHDPPLSEVNTSGSGEESMEHQDDLTDFIPPTPHDSPLSGGHTPGSDEGRPNIKELMAICTKLSNRVLALETSKAA
ncbi:hypothetical protein Tco_1280213, partial [Tanacetum coccineum]